MSSTGVRGGFPSIGFYRAEGTFVWLVVLASALFLGVVVGTSNWIYALPFLAIPLLLKWPVEVALGPYAFLIPFESVAVLRGKSEMMPVEWLLGAAGTLILLITAWGTGRLRRPPKVLLAWGLLMLWLGITVVWAVDPRPVISRLPTMGALFLLYLAAVTIRITRKELLNLVVFICLGGVTAAAYSIYGYFYEGMTYHAGIEGLRDTMRASLAAGGREIDPNYFAASLLLPVSLCAGAFLSTTGKRTRYLALAGFLVLLLSIFLTMSRGSLLALTAIGCVYFLRFRVKKSRIILPLALGAMFLIALPDLFFTRLQQAVATGGAGRLDIWIAGWHALQQYWFLGAGLDNFPSLYNQFAGFSPHFHGYDKVAHNTYLSVAIEGGIFALLMLLYVIRKELENARKFTRQSQYPLIACEAGCWGWLVAGFFLNVLFIKPYWFCWILMEMSTHVYSDSENSAQAVG